MQVFRKKFLILLVTGVAILALVNVSVQFERIVDCFPRVNLSSVLAEEFAETSEGDEKNCESLEFDFLLEKEFHVFHTVAYNNSIGVFLHATGIPPHPHFDKATPPPKG